jgi:GTP-binding protein HflX
LLTPEITRTLTEVSSRTAKQVGIIVNRKGIICHVILGNHHSILIPDISFYRRGLGRLRGLRCIHTHFNKDGGINTEDLSDLELLRLDAMITIRVKDGLPSQVCFAHLLPPNSENRHWKILTFRHPSDIDLPFDKFIRELETEIQKSQGGLALKNTEERAILVHASQCTRSEAEQSLAELAELARSSKVEVLDKIWQHVPKYNPAHLLGKGKLREIFMKGLYLGATLVIFDQDLGAIQLKNIAKLVDIKVIDRTQLILDIFARRAQSREGKIQVELAQLQYLLPRLMGKGTAMSRLMGGIGGRGPGETKLEEDRRKVNQRITSLKRELSNLSKGRTERRKRRIKETVPLISIIGYTNAGKSSLLNQLAGSEVLAEDRLFATLDPITRRFILPNRKSVLLADTVGFIRHMPDDLRVAFKATMEELEDSYLFLHVVDVTSPYKKMEIMEVEQVLKEMNLLNIPKILVYNKIDLLAEGDSAISDPEAVYISALTKKGIDTLIDRLTQRLPQYPTVNKLTTDLKN